MLIKARNTLTDQALYSFLSNDEVAGTNVFRVKNINSFVANWGVQIGKTNEEKAEVLILGTATPSGTSVTTTANSRFEHPADTPIYAIKYDKIVFKRSTTGTAGTATVITSGTVTITADSDYTQFDDTTGISTYAYKACFYNSVTGNTSADSDWLTTSGFPFYSLAKLRERIKRKLQSANYIQEDEIIDDWINEWLEEMTNTAIDVNRDYSIGTVDISYSGTAELGTITSTDFKEPRKISWTNDGSTWYDMTKMNLVDFTPDQVFSEEHPYYYFQGDTVLGRRPNDTSGTARVYYYKTSSLLDNEIDELPVSMQNYTKTFIEYCLAQAYYLDGKDDKGDRFMAFANAGREKFKSEIAPRHKSGPQYINVVAPLSTEDDSELI